MIHNRLASISKIGLAILLVVILMGRVASQETNTLPLSEAGPFPVGIRSLTLTDESRSRIIPTTIWYPALEQAEDAAPDFSGAPYPVIAYSHGYTGHGRDISRVTSHLASYGFVVVAVTHYPDDADRVFIDRPLDVLFALDQLASMADSDWVGLADVNQLGVMGWSLGSTTAFQLGGMGMDWPATQEAGCIYHPMPTRCRSEEFSAEFLSLWEQFGVSDENGIRYIRTERPVRAVVAMATGGFLLTGERGLATATVPTLFMQGTADSNPAANYQRELLPVYNHYGAEDRILISLIGGSHVFPQTDSRVAPLLTAYFGYYLQGREDYAQYLTEDYVNSIEGLAWGPYEEPE